MLKDLQKANMWKRISAALFDFILFCIVVAGAALLLSSVLGYDRYAEQMEAITAEYETQYNVNFELSVEEYNAFTEEEKAHYDQAWQAFSGDERITHAYNMMLNLILLIIPFAILIAYLIMEFMIPLIFRNGQTLGKKIFGIAVMREDGVRVTPLLLFARTVLGKYTVETMLPLLCIILTFVLQAMGIAGIIILLGLVVLQVVLLFATPAHCLLHDKLAHTVAVDFASQRIFDSYEELVAYQKRIHEEDAYNTEG